MALSFPTALRNARLDAHTTFAGNAALLRIYSGTPPASANAALSGNTLLGELVCGSPYAPAASGAVQTANAISNDPSADATGTATFYRLYKADGTTVVEQGTAGTSGTDAILNTTSIVAGGPISCSSKTITEANP